MLKKIFVFLILSSGTLFSLDTLKLEDAIRICLKNSYGIEIARHELRILDNNITAGNAGFLPKINLTADYTNTYGNSKVATATGAELDVSGGYSGTLNAGLSLKWTIFDGLKMFVSYEILKKIREIGELNTKLIIENSVSDVITTYYDIIRQQRFEEFLREQVSISGFRLNIAKSNFESGLGSELELLKAEVDLNFDKSDLNQQITAQNNALATLNEMLSRDISTPFEISDSINIDSLSDFRALKTQMAESNLLLLSSRNQKELNILEARKILSRFYPVLDVQVSGIYTDTKTDLQFIKENRFLGMTAGLSASMNLFNGLNDMREEQNAKIAILNSDIKIKEMQIALESRLTKCFNNYITAVSLIESERSNLAIARKNMNIATDSYSAGSISSLQLREVQKDLLNAGYRLIEAKFKAKIEETQLLLLTNKIIN